MSQLVKTKRQTNFTDFKRFGAIKELVKQKNVVFNSFVCKLGFFGTRGPKFIIINQLRRCGAINPCGGFIIKKVPNATDKKNNYNT
jgi:hypothetical protein